MKKMIFHIPMQIDINLHSGSQIRPQKMIQAFKDIGYDVDVVMGYVKERKNQIKQIKQNIKDGIKYDFLYSESSTMPTALTEKHHLPISPCLDFNFFRFCKGHGIKIGLFYRDVYWIFEEYKKQVPFFKRKFVEFFYRNDLKNYSKYLDVFYLPSEAMFEYVPMNFPKGVISLPPAIEKKRFLEKIGSNNLKFIYVGGLGDLYDLRLFAQVTSTFKDIQFNLCTRKNEWDKNKKEYMDYDSIIVHHKNGDALSSIYENSDIAIYFMKPHALWEFAVGIKLFEYISYKKPIIAVKNTAVGEFVEKYNIGWVINYDKNGLRNLIINLQDNPSQIDDKIKNIEKIIPQHTWEARALQVAEELTI